MTIGHPLNRANILNRLGITPNYTVLEDWGPDHAKHFRVGVYLNQELAGEGKGPSKQEAQQSAAEDALAKKGWKYASPLNRTTQTGHRVFGHLAGPGVYVSYDLGTL